jgi:cell division protein FtsB
MGEGEEDIPWPGFVDILSTVLIVFVFFMMMTSVVIFVLSKHYAKEAVARVQAEAQAQAAVTPAQREVRLQRQVEVLQQQNDTIRQQVKNLQNQLAQAQGSVMSEKGQTLHASTRGSSVVVTFADFGVTLNETTVEQLTAVARQRQPKKVTLVAWPPTRSGTLTTVQQNALNRALNIRNVFLKKGMGAQAIKLRLATTQDKPLAPQEEKGYGAVQVIFE